MSNATNYVTAGVRIKAGLVSIRFEYGELGPIMSNAMPPDYVLPNNSLPKTTGILNIVFASFILLFEIVSIGSLVAAPMMVEFAESQVQEAQAKKAAARNRQIDTLRQQEEEAETAEQKESIREERLAIEAKPLPESPDMKAFAKQMNTPMIQGFQGISLVTGIVLNVLMLISGVGLLRLREWARRLALWVGGFKIARQVLQALINITVIMPISMKAQREMMAQMQAGAGANAQFMESMAKVGAAAGSAMVVLLVVLGVIWPIIMIVLLTRPGSRAACQAASYVEPAPDPFA